MTFVTKCHGWVSGSAFVVDGNRRSAGLRDNGVDPSYPSVAGPNSCPRDPNRASFTTSRLDFGDFRHVWAKNIFVCHKIKHLESASSVFALRLAPAASRRCNLGGCNADIEYQP
jgi:hypothetical protein